MKNLSILIEILAVVTWLYCFVANIDDKNQTKKINIASIIMVFVCVILKYSLFSNYIVIFIFKLLTMAVFVVGCFQKRRLWHFSTLFVIYALLDLLNLIIAFIMPIFMFIVGAERLTEKHNQYIAFLYIISYSCIILFMRKRKKRILRATSVSMRVGTVLLLIFSECILLAFRYVEYNSTDVMFYRILLFAIVFSIIILVLWIFDKVQEQKRLQEMTAYSHRTREVIPSISRVLQKLESVSEHEEQTSEIIQELRLICNSDMERNKKEVAVIKSFETTGCVALDEQLERYLKEAATQGFHLDVVVRASVKDILNEQKIELYSLLQVVGDLYRNAYTAVLKTKKQGRILLCFGYNQRGDYEISVHDNGVAFPQHVLEHLGERGVTTGGTGHGMADIFDVLECNQISYLLNQDLPTGSIFTKSISLVFDGQGNKRIECR